MDRTFIFLVNPISGTASKKMLPGVIAAAAKKHAARYEILPTVASGDYSFIRQKIREGNCTDVIICGGDGSVNSVVQDLRHTNVNFGIVPLGSGNGLAFTAKISKQPVKALETVFTGTPQKVDGFLINHTFACMLCGVGFDAQVAHDFARQKKRGLMTYARQTVLNYISLKPWRFNIDLGDTQFSTDAYFISIANSNQFGNHVTIAPKASLSDGLLDIVVVRKMSKAILPISLLNQIAGNNRLADHRHLKKSGIVYLQTDKLTISNRQLAPLHIDGEPVETAKEFVVTVLPVCFCLI